MNNLLKCKLVMLPDNQKASNLTLCGGKLYYWKNNGVNCSDKVDIPAIPQHLYIISDREIKDGDWMLCNYARNSDGSVYYQLHNDIGMASKGCCKKIEATTDPELHPNRLSDSEDSCEGEYPNTGIPNIPISFIQCYIKNYNLNKKIKECYLELGNKYEGIAGMIKTRNDNTVLIHQIKETFTRDEVIDILQQTYTLGAPRGVTALKEWFNKNY